MEEKWFMLMKVGLGAAWQHVLMAVFYLGQCVRAVWGIVRLVIITQHAQAVKKAFILEVLKLVKLRVGMEIW
jgi:hypothetical protein